MSDKYNSGVIIRTNGNTEPFLTESEVPTLEEMQRAIEGYIERTDVFGDTSPYGILETSLLVVDEEGYIKSLLPNEVASKLASRPIVGDVILIPKRLFV